MIGMWTAAQNRERLNTIEESLKRRDLSERDRTDLEEARDELNAYFMDLWRIEGGGSGA